MKAQSTSRARTLYGEPRRGAAWLLRCVTLSVFMISGAARAQPEADIEQGVGALSERVGGYTVIHSAVRTDALPEIVAERHDIPEGSDTALLNVTVQKDGKNLAAEINATATNLAGQSRDVEMVETVANGLVSYVGVVPVAPEEVVEIELNILPQGATEPLHVEFREDFEPHPLTTSTPLEDE